MACEEGEEGGNDDCAGQITINKRLGVYDAIWLDDGLYSTWQGGRWLQQQGGWVVVVGGGGIEPWRLQGGQRQSWEYNNQQRLEGWEKGGREGGQCNRQRWRNLRGVALPSSRCDVACLIQNVQSGGRRRVGGRGTSLSRFRLVGGGETRWFSYLTGHAPENERDLLSNPR